MRYALAAVILATATAAHAASDPHALVRAYESADENCRSEKMGEYVTTMECYRRASVSGRLAELGWCRGHKGEAQYQMRWHSCGANSVRPPNDLEVTRQP